MQDSTLKILDATLKADGSITTTERNRILKTARNGASSALTESGNGYEPRIYSREEAAKMLGNKTTRFVDLLCRRGLLQKFIPKGNRRAIGVCGESLRAFIEGTANGNA
jgi:hypothetical protein